MRIVEQVEPSYRIFEIFSDNENFRSVWCIKYISPVTLKYELARVRWEERETTDVVSVSKFIAMLELVLQKSKAWNEYAKD